MNKREKPFIWSSRTEGETLLRKDWTGGGGPCGWIVDEILEATVSSMGGKWIVVSSKMLRSDLELVAVLRKYCWGSAERSFWGQDKWISIIIRVTRSISKICVLCALVIYSCPPLCKPMDCSSPGSSVHGILQARTLEWVAIPFSRGIFLTQASNLGLLHCWQVLYCLSHQGKLSHLRDTHIKPYAAHNKHTHTYLTQLLHTYIALVAHTHHTHHVHALPTDSPFILWDPLPLEACPVPPARGWIQRPSGGPLPDPSSLHCHCLSSPAEDGFLKARQVLTHVSTLFPHPCTSTALRILADTSGTKICSSSDKRPVD